MVAQSKKHRKPLRVAATADLHAHQTYEGEYRALFSEISEEADVLALCGDLTNLGLPEEAERLAADSSALKIPCVAVLGNHDHQSGKPDEVKRVLAKAGMHFLDEESFVLDGVGFAGVKGFGGGFGPRMLSSFGEEATKRFVTEAVNEALALEQSIQALDAQRIVVVMHYSPVESTVEGEPVDIYPFIGCSRFAETIDRYDVAAVFHGHAHHGSPTGRTTRGAPVYNCCAELLRKRGKKPYVLISI